jgi:SHS2 domain-containing protein
MYEWREHESELELVVDAPTDVLVLRETMAALAELLGPATGRPQSHAVSLEAHDRAALLAQWLEELVFLAETERFVPEDADLVVTDTRLEGTVRGRAGDPRPLVKAVTYHRLEFERRGDSWHARVVLDV